VNSAASPPAPAELLQRASEHEAAGRFADAEACLDQYLAAAPDDADALHLRGAAVAGLGRTAEAATLIERAIAIGPTQPRYFRNLCEIYRLLGRYDDALRAGLASVAAAPDDPLGHSNLSVLYNARGEPEAAIASAERALAISPRLPSAHFGLAEALLLCGEFERGWEEYEWRFRLPGVPPPTPLTGLPEWDGAPLAGQLLLVADQGFGDSIQFSRYIPWAAGRCEGVALAASRELQPLFRQMPGVASMFDQWGQAPPCVAHCTLSGLPRLHGTQLDNIPTGIPYLSVDPERVAAWRARLDQLAAPDHLKVGVVWAGRPSHRNDANRSLRLADLSPIGELDGVTLVSLQMGPARAEISGYFGRAPLINLGAAIGDFGDTLAIIECLDLVVSVDTSVAHLAGAAGKPVLVMLPHASDWRWLRNRASTPWYPTMRLYRQAERGMWPEVVRSVARAIGREWPGLISSP
jgi:tetratricopeptide (TPR) repeat protein